MQNENKNCPNEHSDQQQQEQIVLFKFKRTYQEESFDEIKIHSKKIKANPESVEKAEKQYRQSNFLDRETMLTQMFQKLELKHNQTQTKNQQKLSVSQQNKITSTYFLKRVEFQTLPQTQQKEHLQRNEQIKSEANRIRTSIRKHDILQRLNKNRGLVVQSQNEKIKKRIKYKIIDIRQENLVQLNGKQVEYEDLSKQYSEEEKLKMGAVYDYYVLKKGQVAGLKGYQPQIILPEEAEYLLEAEQNQAMNEQSPEESEDDSNRQDRSDYDYPQEDYHEGDSDHESEDIISGGRNKNSDYDDDENYDSDLENDYKDEDEQEYYRQYLKRCRRKQNGDDQITYLYNMKPAKYDDDSDQY